LQQITNHLYTLRAVTDTNKNIIKEITYDTFGNILSDSNPDLKVLFGFAGENRKEKANCFAFLGLRILGSGHKPQIK